MEFGKDWKRKKQGRCQRKGMREGFLERVIFLLRFEGEGESDKIIVGGRVFLWVWGRREFFWYREQLM